MLITPLVSNFVSKINLKNFISIGRQEKDPLIFIMEKVFPLFDHVYDIALAITIMMKIYETTIEL